MDEIDIDIRPESKIPYDLDRDQTVENEESDYGEGEEDYSCYR